VNRQCREKPGREEGDFFLYPAPVWHIL
jgi:hypothetical protein